MGGHFRNDTQQQGPNFTIDQTCNDTMQLIDVLLIMFNCGKNCILGNIFAKKDDIPPYWAWQSWEEWFTGLPTKIEFTEGF